MMKPFYKLLSLLLAALMLSFALAGCAAEQPASSPDLATFAEILEEAVSAPSAAEAASPSSSDDPSLEEPDGDLAPDEHGSYTTKEAVALYLHTYGRLPENFVTKKEAQDAGWSGGSLEQYLPGKCIGGSRFGNREGLLPDADGRVWYECDINTLGASSRGAERIVFSNDGLIYYTADHYESFEQLY